MMTLTAGFAGTFTVGYARLTPERQADVDRLVLALMTVQPTPGMRISPFRPERAYSEAVIGLGDRLIFRIEDERVWFMDLVSPDDVERYALASAAP